MLFLLLPHTGGAQTSVAYPCDADPFCTDTAYTFNNTSGNTITAPASPPYNYGCVLTQPNPIWYYMQVATSGTIQITITQTTSGNSDVDFALYGPYPSKAYGCDTISNGDLPIQSSYSASATEIIGIGTAGGSAGPCSGAPGASTPAAAVAGQVYIVLLTNYGNSPGTINFTQTSGTGSADCDIICGLSAGNSGPVCLGGSVYLSGTNLDTVNTFSYYWTGPSGYTANTLNATYTPTAAGTYDFQLLAVSQDGDSCLATTEVVVFPAADVGLVNPVNRTLCNEPYSTIALSNPSSNTFAHYQWFLDGVAISGETGYTHDASVNGTYYVVGTTDSGCSDTSVSIAVKLNYTDVNFDYQIHVGCTEDTVVFSNTSEPGTYWWDYGDGTLPLDTATSPTHIYQDQGLYNVTLKMLDLDGCVDSALKVITIDHPLSAAFTNDIDSVCQTDGTPVTFTNQSIGAYQSHWDFGDGTTSTTFSPTHVFALAGTRQVTLIINDTIPCYDTATTTIYVDSLPFLEIVTDKHKICVGDQVTFTANYLQPAVNLAWDFGDGTTWSEPNTTQHRFDNEGTYWITATASYPVCASTTATDSVVVTAYPIVDLGPDTVLCLDGNAISVADVHNASNSAIKWLWNTGATTSGIEIKQPGIYTVTATLDDCATSASIEVKKDCYTDIPNAFTPDNDGNNDYFYPRQLLASGVVGFQMIIYNRWGQKVFETTRTDGRGWDGRFNGQDQPGGVYIYQIQVVYKNAKTENYSGNVTLIR
ncbi:MAG: PKD domain-containing protein [Edaphocola sp.]